MPGFRQMHIFNHRSNRNYRDYNFLKIFLSRTRVVTFCCKNHRAHSCPCPRCGRGGAIADAHLFIYIHLHPETEVRIMEIQLGYLRFRLCHDDFATQIALDIPLRSVFLHLRHKNLAEIIRDIQNITNFVDGDYDDGRLPTVDSKPLDVQRLCPTAHSSVAHAPTASAWGGGATGEGWTWQRAQRRETPALQVLQNVFSWQGG